MVELLRTIGERKKATPAQTALAWLLAQEPCIVPVPGTTKPGRLEENIGSRRRVDGGRSARIASAASKITVQGDRYPEHLARLTGR